MFCFAFSSVLPHSSLLTGAHSTPTSSTGTHLRECGYDKVTRRDSSREHMLPRNSKLPKITGCWLFALRRTIASCISTLESRADGSLCFQITLVVHWCHTTIVQRSTNNQHLVILVNLEILGKTCVQEVAFLVTSAYDSYWKLEIMVYKVFFFAHIFFRVEIFYFEGK